MIHVWRRGKYVGAALTLIVMTATTTARAQETRKFTVASAATNGLLGFASALSGNVGFAGAPAGVTQPGNGYFFDLTTGSMLYRLEPSVQRSDSLFGFNSRMDDGKLLVGDPGNPFGRDPIGGAAYVFDASSGLELMRLTPDDAFAGDEFGFGINLDEELAIIGAPNLGTGEGAAYLFDIATGSQLRKLLPNDPLAGSEFGADVAVNSATAVVGAPANFDTLGLAPGFAYVFDVATGNQRYKLQPEDSFGGDEFGFDVAIAGDIAVIGAPDGGAGNGAAYLFDVATGQQLFKLTPDVVVTGSDFGSAVDIEGDLIAIGASGLNAVPGAVYLFDARTGQQVDKVTPSDLEDRDAFGISLALSDGRLFAGSARDDDTSFNAGAAYLFEVELPMLPGDFNENGLLDVEDIDLLTLAVINDTGGPEFDLDGDGQLGSGDRDVWVNDLFVTYFGDANLDGQFGTADLIRVLQAGEYEDNVAKNSTWATGDFNGDLEFETSDLIKALQGGGYEQGPRTAVSAVPEPTGLVLLSLALLVLPRRRRVADR